MAERELKDNLATGHAEKPSVPLHDVETEKALLSLCIRNKDTLDSAVGKRIVKENFSDREGDDMHRNDTMQETLSLSDRFGLSVNFSKPDKQVYIDIVLGLADELGIEYDRTRLINEAESWAISRGGRSPRCARQFISSVLVKLNS